MTSGSAAWMPSASVEALRARARLNRLIREFFDARGVLEVETPILSAHATVDRHIQSFQTFFEGPAEAAPGPRWLRTSPEFAMKRLLAAGVGDCYELGRVFRNGEAGTRHNPEFTLLEWYRVGCSLEGLMDEVAALVEAALALHGRHCRVRRCSYARLFRDRLGLDPHAATEAELERAGAGLVMDPTGLAREDWLDLLFSHVIQPQFDSRELLLVHDYPASQAALARIERVDGVAVARRFEAFLGPVELANGYHELRDAAEQERRFVAEQEARRRAGTAVPPYDRRLVEALAAGLPEVSGVALGVDRLLGCMLGEPSIRALLAFDAVRA
ncbi:MAG: elongation factor P--(R)-beta-lysine ligase [Lysobacteraceae bacterium]|nr:MAG: elongation factor P--(R)-beta-lysine ligase [Xanthomonadaceae bacterium]